jgi:group I intron endonuclease
MKYISDEAILKKAGVYKITNTVNGKIYIGSTQCFKERLNKHILISKTKHFNDHLDAAIKKYGTGVFTFEVVEITSLENRFSREQFYIDTLNVLDDSIGYNISPTAEGLTKMPEYVCRKISAALTGKPKPPKTEEYKEWFANHMRSILKSEEHLIKIRENGLNYNKRTMGFKSIHEFCEMIKDYISGQSTPKLAEKYRVSTSGLGRIFQQPTPPLYKEFLTKIGFDGESIKDLRKPEIQAKLQLTQD